MGHSRRKLVDGPDPDGAIAEIDEGNNSVSGGFGVQTKPDLAPSALSLSAKAAKGGDAVTFGVKASNLGEASAGNVVVRFLVDGVQVGADRTIAQLAGGSTVTVSSGTWSAAHRDGQHTVRAIADPANTVVESNEANNTVVATFRVKGGHIVT